jgi:hypothetical protein
VCTIKLVGSRAMAAVEGRRTGPLHTRPVFAAAADAGVSPVGRWSRVALGASKA